MTSEEVDPIWLLLFDAFSRLEVVSTQSTLHVVGGGGGSGRAMAIKKTVVGLGEGGEGEEL